MTSKSKNRAWILAALLPAVLSACGPARPDAASMHVDVQRGSWAFSGVSGAELTTDHYRIYTTTRNRNTLAYLPGFMEGAYAHYLSLTGLSEPTDGKPMPVYVFATREQWAVMTRGITGPRSALYLAIENGGYCYRGTCVFWDMGQLPTFSIAAHEGLHQFFHHRLRDHLPAWAEEGLCVLAEGFEMSASAVRFTPRRNTLRLTGLRRMLSNGRWIALETLLSTDAGDHVAGSQSAGPEYYGQLWALLTYLRSRPRCRAGVERMLADAAAGRLRSELNVPPIMGTGRDYNRAVSVPMFRHYIDPDLAGFERGFRAHARKLARLPPG